MLVRVSLLICALLNFFAVISGDYCNGAPDAGERTNDFPIVDEELTFVRSVKNAMLFEAGPANARFPVVHVWGTPYEMGFAQGTLMKKEIISFFTSVWEYVVTEIAAEIQNERIPQWMKDMIVSKGISYALDWTRRTTEPFTPQAYFDEVQGLSDATGLDYDFLYRLQMYPELTKAHCSFFGAWGKASKGGHAYQLRALDFDTAGPFKNFPQVTIYHPKEGHAWGQVGWPGDIGVLTGFSDQQLAISEIGVSHLPSPCNSCFFIQSSNRSPILTIPSAKALTTLPQRRFTDSLGCSSCAMSFNTKIPWLVRKITSPMPIVLAI